MGADAKTAMKVEVTDAAASRIARIVAGEPGKIAYYVCYGPADTSLAELVQVAGVRWTVECGFQQGKGEAGLDHYQVRRYPGWHRHMTLVMAAAAYLAKLSAEGRIEPGPGDTVRLA